MKKKMIGAMLVISMLAGAFSVQAEEQAADTVTRTADMELSGVKVQFEETLHECEQGYRIWYSADLLKPSEFGGNECFILKEQDTAQDSVVKFTIVAEDDENTVLSLEEPLAAYTSSGETYENLEIGRIETRELESGYVLDWAQVICDDTVDYFYLVRDAAEENVLYITATMPLAEQKTYTVWLNQMVESIEFASDAGIITSEPSASVLQVCSLCEVEKECGAYTVDGVTYYVCDNDYNEFAHAFGLEGTSEETPVDEPEQVSVCSLCEQEKPCGSYTIDGVLYYVCDDDFAEFLHAFGLDDASEEEPVNEPVAEAEPVDEPEQVSVCSLCEQEKPCGSYTIDGVLYYVCDDDFAEFCNAFGLN